MGRHFRFAAALLALAPLPRPSCAGTLKVITVDEAAGKPLAARVSVKGADGEWRWGLDAAGKPFLYGGLPRVWSAGEIEVELPAGKAEVIASRPFSSPPAFLEAEVPTAGAVAVTITLKRGIDLRGRGWYGGDAHTHVVHGERHHAVDLRAAARIARAEGLDWAAFGETWTTLEAKQPPPAELSLLCRALSDGEFLCTWTREHPKDHLGHMAAFPLGGDRSFEEVAGENAYDGSLERRERYAHFEVLRSLREAGSLAVYTHPTREFGGSPTSPANLARELPFDAVAAPWALEALDVLTDAPDNASNLRLWFFLLERGHRLAACGFSDACYDRRGEYPGDTRTYVDLGVADRGGAPLDLKAIVGAVRSGRTFATTGPLVIFKVDGGPPGSVIRAGGKAHTAEVEAWNFVDHHDPRKPAFLTKLVL